MSSPFDDIELPTVEEVDAATKTGATLPLRRIVPTKTDVKESKDSSPIISRGMSQDPEPFVRITRGLEGSDKHFERVPLSEVGGYLRRHTNCYERTNPTEDDASSVLNRIYIDLDGKASPDMSEMDFNELVDNVATALRLNIEDDVCVMDSSQYQLQGFDKGVPTMTNKLSFRIHWTKRHGTKRAIGKFVEGFIPTLREMLNEFCQLNDDATFPHLNVDMSVYKGNRKMRMLGSSKDFPSKHLTEKRPLKITSDGHTFKDTLITLIPSDSVLLEFVESAPPAVVVVPDKAEVENSIDGEDGDDGELLTDVISKLSPSRVDNYNDWVRLGIIIFNEGLGFDVWFNASKRSKHFQAGTHAYAMERWMTFKKGNISQATLWKWLREDNPTAFTELSKLRNDFWTLLKCPNHAEVARYFYNLKPDAYLFNEDLKWYQLSPMGTWKHYERSPSGLLNDIWATFKMVVKEHWEQIPPPPHDDESIKRKVKALGEFARTIGTKSFLDGVVGLLPTNYNDDDLKKKMDESRHLFAFENKVVDLDARPIVVRDILPTDYVCLHAGYKFPRTSDPDVRKGIHDFLMTIWENREDVEYVMRTLAVQLHGTKKFEEFYVWTGRGGNGKGVLSEIIKRAFGNYFHPIPHEMITKRNERKDAPNPPLAQSKGKRVVQAQEPEIDDKFQPGVIKELTGGDEVSCRLLYGNTIQFRPQFGLFVQCNGLPKFAKIDGGVKRRTRIINFPFQFVETPTEEHHRPINNELKDKISKSAEWRDEFILMLLDAFPSIGSSLKMSKNVVLATKDYLTDNDALASWLPAYYDITVSKTDKRYWLPALELIAQFNNDNPDVKDMTAAKFKTLMEMNGVPQERASNNFKTKEYDIYTKEWRDVNRKAGSYYIGIQRKNEDE